MGHLFNITDTLFIKEGRLCIRPLALFQSSAFMELTQSIFSEYIQKHETMMNRKESPIRKLDADENADDKNISKKDIHKDIIPPK